MNFNSSGLTTGQFNCANFGQPSALVATTIVSGSGYQNHPTIVLAQPTTSSNSAVVAMQQFVQQQQNTTGNYVPFTSFNNVGGGDTSSACMQKDVESLKKQNDEYRVEFEKLQSTLTDYNYQMVTMQMKANSHQEEVDTILKQKLALECELKDMRVKYQQLQQQQQQANDNLDLYGGSRQLEDISIKCEDCNFEVKSSVALFIHKLNHHMESTIPRHLQLSPRSFTTVPDDNVRFKYKCFHCTIDPNREYSRHEIYSHIYQFHTFDIPYKCRLCFLMFTSKSYLVEHVSEKHSINTGRGGGGARGRARTSVNKAQQEQQPQYRSHQILPSGYLATAPNKRLREENAHEQGAEGNDINDLFRQLDNTLAIEYHGHSMSSSSVYSSAPVQQQQQQPPPSILELNTELLSQPIPQVVSYHYEQQQQRQQQQQQQQQQSRTSSIRSSSAQQQQQQSTTPKLSDEQLAEQQRRDEEIQKIMNELDGEEGLNCKYPGCKFVASNKNHLKFHISAHLMSKFKCPYCTFVGNRTVEIKRHILKSSKHSDQHVYMCPGCDYATDCDKSFRDHYNRNHSHNGFVDVTGVIERMFANESNLVGQNMFASVSSASTSVTPIKK